MKRICLALAVCNLLLAFAAVTVTSSCASVLPVIKTITDIATDICLAQESKQPSPGDTDIDAFCHDELVLAPIKQDVLGAQRHFAMVRHEVAAAADAGAPAAPAATVAPNPF